MFRRSHGQVGRTDERRRVEVRHRQVRRRRHHHRRSLGDGDVSYFAVHADRHWLKGRPGA